jgi:hypothetical protein
MAIYGCDSAAAVTEATWRGAAQALGGAPSWWGRYLAEYAVSREEVSWLHSRGAAVLLIWNGSSGKDVAQEEPSGRAAAHAAVEAARRLGAPLGTAIVVDVEAGWEPTAEWLVGWAEGVAAAGYVPGWYVAPEASVIVPLTAARAVSPAARGGLVWVAAWLAAGAMPAPLPAEDACPSVAGGPADLWQFAGSVPVGGASVDISLARSPRGLWCPAQPFADVPASAPWAADVADAVAAGLMVGVGGDRFAPDAPLTRAEAAAICARLARRLGWVRG